MQAVKALVVDDSTIFRLLVSNTLSSMPDVSVVGRCRDGKACIESIRSERPDLVTLDVEMPIMSGLETMKEIRRLAQTEEAFRKVRVVIVSSQTKQGADITIQCMNEGAVECIPKPDEGDVESNQESLKLHLGRAVEVLRAQLESQEPKVSPKPATVMPAAPIRAFSNHVSAVSKVPNQKPQVICIGVSTGGPAALSNMLPELSQVTHLPILIVQHMPPGFTKSLAESLDKKCRHQVIEATEGALVENDRIYVAPGGRHMTVIDQGANKKIVLSDGPTENGCRPAVDVLFRSAVQVYGGRQLAIILTGMGSDGTLGGKIMKEKGVYIIVQDKSSSVVWGMPGSAFDAGIADEVVSLMQIPSSVAKCL
jgi:two-component system, chemotaxis family, protein-glutamate methylesterase/glutaminase